MARLPRGKVTGYWIQSQGGYLVYVEITYIVPPYIVLFLTSGTQAPKVNKVPQSRKVPKAGKASNIK